MASPASSTPVLAPRPGLATVLLVLSALAGCLGDTGATPNEAAAEGPADASAAVGASRVPAATPGEANASALGHERHEGYLTFVAAGVYNPRDPAFFPTTFPEGYESAVIEMAWTPSHPTNGDLSLMIHLPDMGGADGMLAEAAGPSPLRIEVTPAGVEPGEYWLVGYVPTDGSTPLVVDQPFEIHVTYFAGPAPADYTALSG